MNDQRNSLKAGIFMLVSLALIVAILGGIKGIGRFLEPNQSRVVVFALSDDIGGLGAGDDVRLGGARVGVVRRVELPNDGSGVRVEFTIPRRFNLRADAVVEVQSTITGVSVLNISSLGTGAELTPKDVLKGRPGSLSSALAAIGRLAPEAHGLVQDVRGTTVPKVNHAIDNANELITKVKDHVDPAVAKYHAVADKGTEALGNISDLFGDTKVDFRTAVANVAGATGTLKEKLPSVMDKTDSALGSLNKALESTLVALEDIKVVASNTRGLTGTARELIQGNRSKIDAFITAIKSTGDNVNAAIADLRRSPWRLLYKPGPEEAGNLNLFDTARRFAEGANDLNDAATALRDALQTPGTPPQKIETLLKELESTFQEFNRVEEELWKKVR
jgi:ABC-type transporter Mla subunit MlaD